MLSEDTCSWRILMTDVVITRNPLFASFDSKFRVRLSKGASELLPKNCTHVLVIADPEQKILTFVEDGESGTPVYRWKHDHGTRIPTGRFALDILGIDPKDVISHRFAAAKGTQEDLGAPSITIHLARKIR